MAEVLVGTGRRVVSPVVVFVVLLVAVAALVLGFGLRTWTESGSGSVRPAPPVASTSGDETSQWPCRIGHPC